MKLAELHPITFKQSKTLNIPPPKGRTTACLRHMLTFKI